MKYVPIGIAPEKDFLDAMNAADFSDEHFEGVQLRQKDRDKAVLIMHSKTSAPMEWKVVYGFSSVFFDTLDDAVAFCEEHGMKLLKGGR